MPGPPQPGFRGGDLAARPLGLPVCPRGLGGPHPTPAAPDPAGTVASVPAPRVQPPGPAPARLRAPVTSCSAREGPAGRRRLQRPSHGRAGEPGGRLGGGGGGGGKRPRRAADAVSAAGRAGRALQDSGAPSPPLSPWVPLQPQTRPAPFPWGYPRPGWGPGQRALSPPGDIPSPPARVRAGPSEAPGFCVCVAPRPRSAPPPPCPGIVSRRGVVRLAARPGEVLRLRAESPQSVSVVLGALSHAGCEPRGRSCAPGPGFQPPTPSTRAPLFIRGTLRLNTGSAGAGRVEPPHRCGPRRPGRFLCNQGVYAESRAVALWSRCVGARTWPAVC